MQMGEENFPNLIQTDAASHQSPHCPVTALDKIWDTVEYRGAQSRSASNQLPARLLCLKT